MSRPLTIRKPNADELHQLHQWLEQPLQSWQRRRAEVLLLYAADGSVSSIAQLLQVHRNTVSTDLREFARHGLSALSRPRKLGAPPRLLKQQIAAISPGRPSAHHPGARLSSLCSFRTLYFTPESGPATEGFSCRGAVMNDEGNAARKIRKLRASRDLWKHRSAEKQQEIRQLRVTVRDLSSSRENWKTRVKELEQQLQAAHEAHAAVGPGSWIFFGGLMDNQAMPRTRRTPITLSSD